MNKKLLYIILFSLSVCIIYADLNIDGLVNVVDIVQLVNTILIPLSVNPIKNQSGLRIIYLP